MTLSTQGIKLVAGILIVSMLCGFVLAASESSPDNNTVAKLLPANTLAYVTVALSPSLKQKATLALMSQHLPPEARAAKAGAAKDTLLVNMFNSLGLDYNNEIKSWLGSEAALAVLPPVDGSNTPIVVLAVETKNQEKAWELLQAHEVDTDLFRFMKNYVFFVDPDQVDAHQAPKALDQIESVMNGHTPSLQSNAVYKSDLALLHGEHIVLGYADLPGLAKLGASALNDGATASLDSQFEDFDLDPTLGDWITPGNLNKDAASLQAKANAFGTVAFEAYAETSGVNFQAVTEHASSPASTSKPSLLPLLPANTSAAVDVDDVDAVISGLIGQMDDASTSADIASLVKNMSSEGVLTVVHNADDTNSVGFIGSVNDESAASTQVSKFVADFGQAMGVAVSPLSVNGGQGWQLTSTVLRASSQNSDGSTSTSNTYIGVAHKQLVVANSESLLKSLMSSANGLSSSSDFNKALPNQSQATSAEGFVDLKSFIQGTSGSIGSTTDSSTGNQWADSLSALGYQSWSDGAHDHLDMRLVFAG
jgi:hypothetical protein